MTLRVPPYLLPAGAAVVDVTGALVAGAEVVGLADEVGGAAVVVAGADVVVGALVTGFEVVGDALLQPVIMRTMISNTPRGENNFFNFFLLRIYLARR
jgi:hypothetical protein